MAAAGVLYAASRLAIFAIARADGSNPGRRAIAQWLPIAATAIAAVLWPPQGWNLVDFLKGAPSPPDSPVLRSHLASFAVTVVLGTSIACLSLVLGMATWLAPLTTPPPSRRVWPFVFPAALLALMAGFSAHLTWWHGVMLLALGGAIVSVWMQSPEEPDGSDAKPPKNWRVIALVVAVVLCGAGACLDVWGVLSIYLNGHGSRLRSPGTLAASIVSPLLLIPTLITATSVAHRGHAGRALTALVGTVLLNLCVLLPITIFLWYLRSNGWHAPAFKEFSTVWETTRGLPYDIAAWRIENVLLVVLGFALIALSMGRITVGRIESALLVFIYAAYMIAQATLSMHDL